MRNAVFATICLFLKVFALPAFFFAVVLFLPYTLVLPEEFNFSSINSEPLFKEQKAHALINAPTDILGSVLWVDATDTTTLNTNVSCTTSVVADGDRVQCWEDKSGQNNHIRQSVVVDSPFYRLNQQNSLPALEFDDAPSGNDDRLFTSTGGTVATQTTGQIAANGSYTKFVVFKYDSLTGSNNMVSSNSTGSAFWGGGSPNNGRLHAWNVAVSASNPGHVSSPTQLTTTEYYIGATRYENIAGNSVLSILNVNGTEVDTDNTVQNHTAQPISIGSHGTATTGLDGRIGEVVIYNRALTDSEIDDVECYLSAKWGITVTTSCSSFVVSPAVLTVAENGGTGTFTVVLGGVTPPNSDVVFTVASSNTSEATISPSILTFTPADWNTPQTVTVTGVDDNLSSNDIAIITVSVNDALSDSVYDSLEDRTVSVTLTNDDAFVSNIPTDFADLTLWLDADDSTTLYKEAACTSFAIAGDDVGCWKDKSGQSNHATGTAEPTLLASQLNGKPTLDFASDFLEAAGNDQITPNGSYTKFVVFKYDTTAGPNNLVSSRTGNSNGHALWGANTDSVNAWNLGSMPSPGHVTSGPVGVLSYHVATTRYENVASNAILSVINIDGTEADTDNLVRTHSGTINGVSIGAHNGASFLDGKIGEVIVYNRALDDDEIDCVEAYLGDKWSIPVSNGGSQCVVPNSISLTTTSYPQYKVFQRDITNQHDFVLSGTYTGICSAVEASFDGGAYTVIDAAPTGLAWSGILSNQGVGQGRLSVRCTNDITAEDGVDDIGIGDVYIVAGQSNAEGNALIAQQYTTVAPTATVFPTVYTESDVWKIGNDDTDPGGNAGSVWPIVGGYIVQNTNVPVLFITTATGGTDLHTDWQQGNSAYTTFLNQLTEADVNDVKAILWFQGETDASDGRTRTQYNANLDQLILDFQSDTPGTPDLVAGVIGPWIRSSINATQIRLAIQDAWNDNPLIKNGPQTYDIHISDDPVGDDIHFQSNDEIQTLGFRWWKALQEHYYGGSEGRGPQIVAATIATGGAVVTVDFVTNSSLQGTSTAPWFVDDNGIDRDVVGVTILDTDTIQLTLAAPITSTNIKLTYAKNNTGENVAVLTNSTTGNTASGTSPLPADVFSDFPVTVTSYTTSIAQTTHGAENGLGTPTNAVFTISLNQINTTGSPITGTFSVAGTAANGADYTTAPTTFSIANGASSTTVTLTVTEDILVEGTETIIATISAPSVGTIATPTATADIIDDETAGVTITPNAVSVTEGGTTANYTVVLNTQPTATVTITPTSGAEASISPASLTFTTLNWNTPQTVTVTAVNDSVLDGTTLQTITHAASSTDPFYAGVVISSVSATVTDNEVSLLYNGNTNTGGITPTDPSSPYNTGATVTVLGNTGSLVRSGHTFTGWNTQANGSGTPYAPAGTFSITANTTLYAQWAAITTPTAATTRRGSMGGGTVYCTDTITTFCRSQTTQSVTATSMQTGLSTTRFIRDLRFRMNGEDVRTLQRFLNANGFTVAQTGPGSKGNETTIFGGATRAALSSFQRANNITPAVGFFGPITRGVVNDRIAN
ncbi:MAG: InlB B-repeat-containing protein [Candidatus Pacebacteria bacterium]|jgi:uncharacterized repeat protein (TIGR02543 family)|nr:InlB B-repeat-containing protein [Candidatus Paceibacterota bacterium]